LAISRERPSDGIQLILIKLDIMGLDSKVNGLLHVDKGEVSGDIDLPNPNIVV
jgi:hypothetical protein